MPRILIFSVNSIGRHFVTNPIHQNSDCAMLNTGIHCTMKQHFHLLRSRRSRNIPVIRFAVQYTVADAAANRPCFISGTLQNVDNLFYCFRQYDFDLFRHLSAPFVVLTGFTKNKLFYPTLYRISGTKKRLDVSSLLTETRGIRTPDNLIKSQVLYRLS